MSTGQFELDLGAIPKKKSQVGLIDADSIMFNLGWYFEKADLLAPGDSGLIHTAPDFVYTSVESFLDKLRKQMNVDTLHLHFTGNSKNKALFEEFTGHAMKPQFRSTLGMQYKSNRKELLLPTGYHYVLRALLEQPNAYIHDQWEADEAIILHKKLNPDWILSSNDKDVYKQHNGKNWLYDKRRKWVDVSAEFANYFAFLQAITGDPSDGFDGAPGIGPSRAVNFIDVRNTPTQNWAGVVEAFATKGLQESDALINMRFANMHQLKLDATGKPVIDLWTPSGHHLEPVWK